MEANPVCDLELRLTCHVGKPSSGKAWDEAVANSRDTWLYHGSRMAGACRGAEDRPPLFLECRLADRLVGGAILSIQKRRWHGIFQRLAMHGADGSSWTSPFVVADLDAKVGDAVFHRLVGECAAVAAMHGCEEIRLNDTPQSLRCIEDRPIVNRYMTLSNWQHVGTYYWLLDLRPDEAALWKKVATSQRTQIKNARARLQVVEADEVPNAREEFASLMACINRREGFEVAGEAVIRGHWETIFSTESGRVFFCLADGKPCAVAGFGRHGKVASYIHAGRRDDAMNGAAAVALWSGIVWAKAAGCEWFDLNSMIPEHDRQRERALSQFKKRFGGDVIMVHGALRQIAAVKPAACELIDCLGSYAKRAVGRLLRREAAAATLGNVQVSAVGEELPESRWEIARESGCPGLPEQWDQAVAESRETWLIHFSRLAPLFLPAKAEPITFLELRLDGRLVGGAILDAFRDRPGMLGRKLLRGQVGTHAVSPFLVKDLSADLAERAWKRLLHACFETACQRGCLDVILSDTIQSPRVVEDREIVSRYHTMSGWIPLLTCHYLLDLSQALGLLFQNVQSWQQSRICRAREQYQVVSGKDYPAGRDAHLALAESVDRREGKAVVPRQQRMRIYDEIYDGQRGEAIFLLQAGRPVAFTGMARFRGVASRLQGGQIDEVDQGAGALGFWAGVQWAKEAGCRWLDCGAATFDRQEPERMLVAGEFANSFGGNLVRCHGARRIVRTVNRAAHDFIDACHVAAGRLLGRSSSIRRRAAA